MQAWNALLIALFFGCGTYLIQRNSFVRVLFGFSLLTHGAHMLILTMAGPAEGLSAPIVSDPALAARSVDPLPQALILTSIVISFGVTAYLCTLLYRLFLDYRTARVAEVYQGENAQRRAEALEAEEAEALALEEAARG